MFPYKFPLQDVSSQRFDGNHHEGQINVQITHIKYEYKPSWLFHIIRITKADLSFTYPFALPSFYSYLPFRQHSFNPVHCNTFRCAVARDMRPRPSGSETVCPRKLKTAIVSDVQLHGTCALGHLVPKLFALENWNFPKWIFKPTNEEKTRFQAPPHGKNSPSNFQKNVCVCSWSPLRILSKNSSGVLTCHLPEVLREFPWLIQILLTYEPYPGSWPHFSRTNCWGDRVSLNCATRTLNKGIPPKNMVLRNF